MPSRPPAEGHARVAADAECMATAGSRAGRSWRRHRHIPPAGRSPFRLAADEPCGGRDVGRGFGGWRILLGRPVRGGRPGADQPGNLACDSATARVIDRYTRTAPGNRPGLRIARIGSRPVELVCGGRRRSRWRRPRRRKAAAADRRCAADDAGRLPTEQRGKTY